MRKRQNGPPILAAFGVCGQPGSRIGSRRVCDPLARAPWRSREMRGLARVSDEANSARRSCPAPESGAIRAQREWGVEVYTRGPKFAARTLGAQPANAGKPVDYLLIHLWTSPVPRPIPVIVCPYPPTRSPRSVHRAAGCFSPRFSGACGAGRTRDEDSRTDGCLAPLPRTP